MKCPVVVYKIVFLLQERIACFKYIQDLEVFQGRGKVGITEVISVQKMLHSPVQAAAHCAAVG